MVYVLYSLLSFKTALKSSDCSARKHNKTCLTLYNFVMEHCPTTTSVRNTALLNLYLLSHFDYYYPFLL